MSRLTIHQVGLALLFVGLAVGCSRGPEVDNNSVGGLTTADREDYVTEIDGKLNGLASQLDAFNEQVDQLPEDQRQQWREKAMKLEESLREAKSQLSEFTNDSGEQWTEQKQQLEKTVSELSLSIENAASGFDFPNIPAPE